MLNKTIAKFSGFVILTSAAAVFFNGCAFVASNPRKADADPRYGPPKITGTIKSADITESSGIAASKCQNNVLWTHNDSGDDAFVFAMNNRGDSLGTWRVPNAQNIDWEDIATYKDRSGKCSIYIGEIGDNKSKRHEHTIYRIPEPIATPADATSDRKDPLSTDNPEVLRFVYQDFNQDAETLMVHPITGDIYVVTKRVSGPAGAYRLKPEFKNADLQKAEEITEISVPSVPNGFITGGDISPDGRRLILCDYTQAYEFVLPETAENFEEIWRQEPETIEIGRRAVGEAVCYSIDGTSIFATSERLNSPLIELHRRK